MARSLLGDTLRRAARAFEECKPVDLKKKTELHFHGILVVIIHKLLCKDTSGSIAVFGVGTRYKDTPGHLNHYYDRVWVYAGEQDVD